MPDPVLGWRFKRRGNKLLLNGHRLRLNGVGLYFIWERRLSKQQMKTIFGYLQQRKINMVRVFALSRFQEREIKDAGLPEWCIYNRVNTGKYDLYGPPNKEYLNHISSFCKLARQYGVVVQIVLGDHCGFKRYESDRYGWCMHPWNRDNAAFNKGFKWNGSSYFGWYEANAELDSLWASLISKVVHACGRWENVIWECTNEAPYNSSSKDWIDRCIKLVRKQYKVSKHLGSPIFADSSSVPYGYPSTVHIYYEHKGWRPPNYNGLSTDGQRYNQFDEYELVKWSKYCKENWVHTETHMAFLSKHPSVNGNPEDITAFMWFGRSATIEDWNVFNPYWDLIG